MMVPEEISNTSVGRIVVKLKLNGAAVYGNNFAIGREERPRTRTTTIFRNDLRKVVTTPGYGVRKLDAKLYKLYETHIDDLSDYNKEHDGLETRQAILERYGETLMYGDTAAVCTRNWNMNIHVCGLPYRTCSPTYSNNVVTYTANIIQKLKDSGGGSIKIPHTGQVLDQPNLSNLQNLAIAKRITPLKIPGLPGGEGWVVTISELQAVYLGDPAWSNRNMGHPHMMTRALPEKVMSWPGVLFAWKKLLIVEDPRQPTIDITGTSDPFGLSAGYLWPGDEDERHRDENTVCDTAFLLGRGAYINWYPEKVHHIQQLDDYGKIVGHGTALVRGKQTPLYTDENGNNPEQFSSIVSLCRLPDYT